MKKILGLFLALMVLAPSALAQSGEQQVYYPPYMTRSALTQNDLAERQNYILLQQQARLENNYIERDPTATYQDRIPMHPGDYRDAFDRGEIPNLGGYSHKTGKPITR